ncbi:hypothetical protein EBN15_19895 [Xanthomonas cucurbitae]|nr:hypothetical protein EBN15_19895 [Xanthomonas cucurbitae]
MRRAVAITFLVTAPGLPLGGVGAAFRGLMAGTLRVLALRPQPSA